MRSLHNKMIAALVAAWLMLALGTAQTPPSPSPEASCRAAMIGFRANIESFPAYRCRYTITSAHAATVADALAGKVLDGATSTVNQLVDGDSEMIEQDAAPPPDPSTLKPGKDGFRGVSTPFASMGYLGNGRREAMYSPTLKALNLLPRDAQSGPEIETPLEMGGFLGHRCRRGPDNMTQDRENYEAVYVGPEIVDGAGLITVKWHPRGNGAELYSCSLDPKRGYLPALVTVKTRGGHNSSHYLAAARECSRGRWFPERVVRVSSSDDQAVNVREIRVVELDVDKKPDKKDFILNLPGGTVVLYLQPPSPFFRTKQDEAVGLDDLDRLYKMLDQSKTDKRMDTAVVQPSRWRWWAWAGSGLGVLVVLAGLVMLVRRRRFRA